MKRKLLAMLLSIIMLISILPASTFAAEDVVAPADEQLSLNNVEPAPTGSADVDPTDPAEPTPTNSVSADPTDPVEPTPTNSVSADPTDPVEPAPTNSVSADPTDPVEPAPTNSVSADPTDPVESAPTNSVSTDPTNPVSSDDATDDSLQFSPYKMPQPTKTSNPTPTSDPQKSFETATFSHIDLRIHTAKLTINNVITDENGSTISSSSSTITAHLKKINSCKVNGTSISGSWSWGTREARINYKTNGSSLQTISFNVDLEDDRGNVYSNVEITFGLDGIKAAAKNCDGYDNGKYDGLDFDLSTNANHTTTCTSAGLKIEVVKKISENGQLSSFNGNGGEFSFALNCTNDSTKSQTVSVDANGKASFTLSFGYSDVGKTFYYTLTESKSDSSIYEANTQSYSFSVKVTKSESGDKITIKPTLVGSSSYTFTNVKIPQTTSVSVKKVWNDADDQDGQRPDSVTVTLYADGNATNNTVTLNAGNSWTATFSNLPKYENGEPIIYTVMETNVADGYTFEVTGDAANGFTITNYYAPVTEVTVRKVWEGDEGKEANRPAEITVRLKADGQIIKELKLSANANTPWCGIFEDLPVYNSNGQKVVYTVEEAAVEKYTASVEEVEDYFFDIINTLVPETTSVKVTKVWDDMGDYDRLRPDSITVQLLLNGKERIGEPVELNEANKWSHTFTDLLKYDDAEFAYTIEEVDVPKGYTSKVTGDAANGFTITNTHIVTPVVSTTSRTVIKNWKDDNDSRGQRPTSVKVQLYADGKAFGAPVVITECDGWTYTFSGLPIARDGKEIVYTVKEIDVPAHYYAKYSSDTFTITNVYSVMPKTGVEENTAIWWALAALSVLAIIGVQTVDKKRRSC